MRHLLCRHWHGCMLSKSSLKCTSKVQHRQAENYICLKDHLKQKVYQKLFIFSLLLWFLGLLDSNLDFSFCCLWLLGLLYRALGPAPCCRKIQRKYFFWLKSNSNGLPFFSPLAWGFEGAIFVLINIVPSYCTEQG